jgi:hypothetical protein
MVFLCGFYPAMGFGVRISRALFSGVSRRFLAITI